ncbi:MAG TPA: hypothetical protein PKO06_13490 [Candidatus Ozemobacteraceae bacterium]|nr:hypothetical protein [Candidatus Ozemobacteraceae bacterium]
MIEVLIAVVVLATAMGPILFLTMRTTSQAYSTTKHLIAGQFAASLMDWLLVENSYEQCKKMIDQSGGKQFRILDDPLFQDALFIKPAMAATTGGQDKQDMEEDLGRVLKSFHYEVSQKAGTDDKMVLVTVKVSWLMNEDQEASRQFLTRKAIKFRERL